MTYMNAVHHLSPWVRTVSCFKRIYIPLQLSPLLPVFQRPTCGQDVYFLGLQEGLQWGQQS